MERIWSEMVLVEVVHVERVFVERGRGAEVRLVRGHILHFWVR